MPGSETEGKSFSQPEAFKASKQDADAKFKDNVSDIDPRFKQETAKGYNEDGTVKTAADGNERSDVDRDMGVNGNK